MNSHFLPWHATVDGEETPVQVSGGFGGAAEIRGLQVAAINNVWSLVASSHGSSQPAGYYHLTTLNVEDTNELGCDPGSVGLLGLDVVR